LPLIHMDTVFRFMSAGLFIKGHLMEKDYANRQ